MAASRPASGVAVGEEHHRARERVGRRLAFDGTSQSE
jgi:hypothetical protein